MKYLEMCRLESMSDKFPSLKEVEELLVVLEKKQDTLSKEEYAKDPDVVKAKQLLEDIKEAPEGELKLFKDSDTLSGLNTHFKNHFASPPVPWLGVREGQYLTALEEYRTKVIEWLKKCLGPFVERREITAEHADRVLARTCLVLSRQSDVDRSPPLPMLCSLMMETVNQMFLRTPLAQKEVSVFSDRCLTVSLIHMHVGVFVFRKSVVVLPGQERTRANHERRVDLHLQRRSLGPRHSRPRGVPQGVSPLSVIWIRGSVLTGPVDCTGHDRLLSSFSHSP